MTSLTWPIAPGALNQRSRSAPAETWTQQSYASRIAVATTGGDLGYSGETMHDRYTELLGYRPGYSSFVAKHSTGMWNAYLNTIDQMLEPTQTGGQRIGASLAANPSAPIVISVPPIMGPKAANTSQGSYVTGGNLTVSVGNYGLNWTTGAMTSNTRAAEISADFDRCLNGDYDTYHRQFVDKLIDYGHTSRPVYLRLGHEMTNPAYIYCTLPTPSVPDQPGKFAQVWRHVVDVMKAHAVSRVGAWPSNWKWVLNPQSAYNVRDNADVMPNGSFIEWIGTFWPGTLNDPSVPTDYVDVLSFNVYSRYQKTIAAGGNNSWEAHWNEVIAFMLANPHLQFGICEFGNWDTAEAGWPQDTLDFFTSFRAQVERLPPSQVAVLSLQAESQHNALKSATLEPSIAPANETFPLSGPHFFATFGTGS